ncbi:MAG: NosD domain-containing protein [Candidatus Thorarchaeota archaeon]
MVRRGVAILFVVVLSFSFMISTSMTDVMKSTEMTENPRMYEISYDSHAPFNITSNIDFETQGWPGDGSATDPYRIQNLNITSTNSTCIWIMNTTSHFIIEDCWFASPIDDYPFNQLLGPITLTNVSNGKVERNHIVDSFTAVSGYRILNCSISDNSLSVSYQGISVISSNSTVVSNNTQGYEPCHIGLSIYHCRNCTISLNEFKNITFMGMTARSTYDIHIVENSFTASTDEYELNWAGINARGSLCTIQRNELSGFDYNGIEVSGDNFTVQDNNITSCSTGITISTNNSTVTGNRINGSSRPIEMHQSNDTVVNGNFLRGRSRIYHTGIAMYGGHDCDIYSNTISQVGQGIYLQGATRFNISGNTVTEGRYGFVFGWYSNWWDSPTGPFFNCDIINNTFDSGGVYPIIESYESWDFDTIRFEGNTVQGRPIGFFANLDSGTIDGNAFGQLLLVSCSGITISGGDFHDISSDRWHDIYYSPGEATAIALVDCTAVNLVNINFHNNTYGITLQDSFQCSITGGTSYYNSWRAISLSDSGDIDVSNVDIRNSPIGIELSWSYDCSISNCQIGNNEEGIFLRVAFNCTLSLNTIFQNTDGIYMEDSDDSEILNNTVYLNHRGILLNSTSDCLIIQNNIYNNTGVGICLDSTANRNEIFNNTFAYNTPNAICEGTSNHWDDQVDTGNWWSDYSGEGAYIIDENDQDNFPIISATTTTNGTIPNLPWFFNPLLIGIVGGAGIIIGLIIIIENRRRIVVVE